ncbi:MAG: hypothetical protein RR540_08025 [Oscillospiraceae bacterium]
MKKGFGLVMLALVSAAAGAVATMFALKKRDELAEYDYDFDDDEEFFNDCDTDDCCESCECPDCCDCCDTIDESDDIPDEKDDDAEIFEDEIIEDNDEPKKSDF